MTESDNLPMPALYRVENRTALMIVDAPLCAREKNAKL
jgi:hypothetical protein